MTKRNTIQKSRILKYLKSVHTHPTAEAVHEGVKEDMPTISLGTVYRNLNLLAQQGEILKFELNNEAHFDGDTCNHQHFVCKSCGRIMDVFQEEISKYALKTIKPKGFKPKCVSIIFSGLCNKCK